MDPLWLLFLGLVVVVGGILLLRLHAFLALLLGAGLIASVTPAQRIIDSAVSRKIDLAAAEKLAQQSAMERVARQFGNTCGQIGILIALAAIVGKCLLESGSATRIVRSALHGLGEARAPLAFWMSGFLLGIPVFFDTVFLLMIPLGKAMRLQTGRNYLLYVLTIIAGATMTHSLVPPTPGPLFIAGELGVNMGMMILGGCVVGAVASLAGISFAYWINQRVNIPLRESPGATLAHLQQLAAAEEKSLPPLWLALLPIVLPVALIGGVSVWAALLRTAGAPGLISIPSWLRALSEPNVALGVAAAVALGTLAWSKREGLGGLARDVQSALEEGGLIILITAAGGAFGGVLQQTGIGSRIAELSNHYQIAVLPLAFGVTALVRVAQGSATVAMITAAGIVSGMAVPAQLGFHPVYLALAIGCGSKLIPWMNDSGFWVVCKMSAMTEAETLKTFSPMSALMGLTGLITTILLARFFPLL